MGKSEPGQRSKTRAATSSAAAELLAKTSGGFVGFDSVWKSRGVEPAGEPGTSTEGATGLEYDTNVDGEMAAALRRLSKKDATTKIKALSELKLLIQAKPSQDTKHMITYWGHAYQKLAVDNDRRVRENASLIFCDIAVKDKKAIGKVLKGVLPVWWCGTRDPYGPAAQAAERALASSFAVDKIPGALGFARAEMVRYFVDTLHQTAEGLAEKGMDKTEKEDRYERIVSTAILGLARLMTTVSGASGPDGACWEAIVDGYDKIFDSALWKLTKSKSFMVRRAMYELIASLCTAFPTKVAETAGDLAKTVLGCVGDHEAGSQRALWESVLGFIKTAGPERVWGVVDANKVLYPPLFTFLRGGVAGAAETVYPCLLPLVSLIPDISEPAPGSDAGLPLKLKELVESIWTGLKAPALGGGRAIHAIRAHSEVLRYVMSKEGTGEAWRAECTDLIAKSILMWFANDEGSASVPPGDWMEEWISLAAYVERQEGLAGEASSLWKQLTDAAVARVAEANDGGVCGRCNMLIEHLAATTNSTLQARMTAFAKAVVESAIPRARTDTSRSHLSLCRTVFKVVPGPALVPPGEEEVFARTTLVPWVSDMVCSAAPTHALSSGLEIGCHFFTSLLREGVETSLVERLSAELVSAALPKDLHGSLSTVDLEIFVTVLTTVGSTAELATCIAGDAVESMAKAALDKVFAASTSSKVPLSLLESVLGVKADSAGPKLAGAETYARIVTAAAGHIETLRGANASGMERLAAFLTSLPPRLIEDIPVILDSQLGLVQSIFMAIAASPPESALVSVQKAWKKQCSRLLLSLDAGRRTTILGGLAKTVSILGATTSPDAAEHAGRVLSVLVESSCADETERAATLSSAIGSEEQWRSKWQEAVSTFKITGGDEWCVPHTVTPAPSRDLDCMAAFLCSLLTHAGAEDVILGRSSDPSPWLATVLASMAAFVSEPVRSTIKSTFTNSIVPAVAGSSGSGCTPLTEGSTIKNMFTTIAHELLEGCLPSASKQMRASCPVGLALLFPSGAPTSTENAEAIASYIAAAVGMGSGLGADIVAGLEKAVPCFTEANISAQASSVLTGALKALGAGFKSGDSAASVAVKMRLFNAVAEACARANVDGAREAILSVHDTAIRLMNHFVLPDTKGSDSDSDSDDDDDGASAGSVPARLMCVAECVRVARLVAVTVPSMPADSWGRLFKFLGDRTEWITRAVQGSLYAQVRHHYERVFEVTMHTIADVRGVLGPAIVPDSSGDGILEEYTDKMHWADFWIRVAPALVRALGMVKDPSDALCVLVGDVSDSIVTRMFQLSVANDDAKADSRVLVENLCRHLGSRRVALIRAAYAVLKQYANRDQIMVESSQEVDVKGVDKEAGSVTRRLPTALARLLLSPPSTHKVEEGDHAGRAEAYGYLMAWRVFVDTMSSTSMDTRTDMGMFVRQNNISRDVFAVVFTLIGELGAPAAIPSVSDPLGLSEVNPLNVDIVDKASMGLFGASMYYMLLRSMPTQSRIWYAALDRSSSATVSKFTGQYVSPLILRDEVATVNAGVAKQGAMDELTVKASKVSREVTATYATDDGNTRVQIVIRLPDTYPLRMVEVSTSQTSGIAEGRWRRWLLSITNMLNNKDGAIYDAVLIWKDNVVREFEGIEECPICYAVVHWTTKQLPKMACKTCKHKFHSACLYKWFSTSRKSECPLCKSLF